MQKLTSKEFFQQKFIPAFSPLALLGLLYTILVLFAYQGDSIVSNVRPVFRVFIPLILYFTIMWAFTFILVFTLSRSKREARWGQMFSYEMAVVQAFTASSNNFVGLLCFAITVEFI